MHDSELGLFTIAPGAPFLRCIARGLCDVETRNTLFGDIPLHDFTIFLPTQRAVQGLGDAIFEESRAKAGAIFLPQLVALGDFDASLSDEGLFAPKQSAGLLPAIGTYHRQFFLAQAILKWSTVQGQAMSLPQAMQVGRDLASFLDQAQADEVDWAGLTDLVPTEMAQNWEATLDFLAILTRQWPAYLQTTGLMDPVQRRNQAIDDLIASWQSLPPHRPVLAVGSTGSVAATARLLAAIARLPCGAVVLPGLDVAAPDTIWHDMISDPTHPQTSMARWLSSLGVERKQVRPWPNSPASNARAEFLNWSLVPVDHTGDWNHLASNIDRDAAIANLSLLEAPDPRAEAGAIAVMMREILETADETAALVTSDRNLARRVASELRRWNIQVDDSAGAALRQTEAGSLLLLLLQGVLEGFKPVPLLALLKHPWCCLDVDRTQHLQNVRALEAVVLRGPVAISKIEDVISALARHDAQLPLKALPDVTVEALQDFLHRLRLAVEPILSLRRETLTASQLFSALRAALDALGSGDTMSFVTLQGGDEVLSFLEKIEADAEIAPAATLEAWAKLLDLWLDATPFYRSSGREARLFIWGPLEARLLTADLVILGGLNEGSWPPQVETGPWLSRPMRSAMGMNQPERRIGLAAHDFVQNASAPRVVLSRAQKVDGAPTIAARWLRRMTTLAGDLPRDFAAQRLSWWLALDHADRLTPAARPNPKPDLAARPSGLSVTRLEALLVDPYRIYASHILNLREWEDVGASPQARHRGSFLHDILEKFVDRYPDTLPEDVEAEVMAIAEDMLRDPLLASEGMAISRARLRAAISWMAAYETSRRHDLRKSYSELTGHMQLPIAGAPFTISAKADRIDALQSGGYRILDYKTGIPPSDSDLENLFSLQLVLEAAILRAGGFKDLPAGLAERLDYIRLSGGFPPGELHPHDVDAAMIDKALAGVENLITLYRDPEQGYISQLRPKRISFPSAYDHLARVAEWSSQGGGDE
jgi:ATP-dependent helicase/nuclease subunit B